MRNKIIAKIIFVFVAFALISCGKTEERPAVNGAARQVVELSARTDRVEATIGDMIEYSIDISAKSGVKITIPDFSDEISEFDIVDFGEAAPREVDDRIVMKRWYRLQADAVGSYIIPKVAVAYTEQDGSAGELETEEIFIKVKSAIGDDAEFKDIIDIKPLLDIKSVNVRLIIIIAASLSVLAVLIIVILRRIRRRRGEFIEILPAHEIAYKELDELKRAELLKEHKIKAFHFRLSEIFRRYLEARYSFNASEWTTEEILPYVEKNLELDDVLKSMVETLLKGTDIVKFTDIILDEAASNLELSRAYKFVDNTLEREDAPANNADESDAPTNGPLLKEVS